MRKLMTLLALVLTTASSHAAITWYWAAVPSDTAIRDQIAASMNTAVANYNTYSNYNANIPVRYVPGVPTAQASWGGEIQFGGQRGARTAQHEMAHWMACGAHSGWTALMTGGSWDGIYANSKVQAYDGTANISGDSAHFWPYGWNYDSEGTWPQRNIGIVGGLRRDMGLSDETIGIAASTFDAYRLQNRASGKGLDSYGATVNGSNAVQWGLNTNQNQYWLLTIVDGTYFSLKGQGGGLYLDSYGGGDDTPVRLHQLSNHPNQHWSIIQTDSGYYKIINRATGKCLDTGGATADGSAMENWYNNASYNQQWKFLN
ncbi:MAG: hypothetical protein EOP84_07440 [Verrucomicrobiaceae bacterium]|nr:MAG: hypothetical protein EOP84_07440 [Verrucomicrobiaceae bacterium]